ncbi:MAG TPA: hypothetical protein VN256_24240 [Pyrinomonadaceae bacterium]|nr:hypothetical protein [Pyrinomonadaceae bacterium]
MKEGKQGKRHDHNHLVPHQGEPSELAARLTPLEETQGRDGNNGGAIVVDNAALRLPKDFTERKEKKGLLFGLEPIGVIILVFALAFITFIAYLISAEPVKSGDGPAATIEDGR